MNERIIIENRTDLSMNEVLPYVKRVIAQGRISKNGTQYCYVTSWWSGLVVYADKNKRSDRFVVVREGK
jgi:hypothetical protein